MNLTLYRAWVTLLTGCLIAVMVDMSIKHREIASLEDLLATANRQSIKAATVAHAVNIKHEQDNDGNTPPPHAKSIFITCRGFHMEAFGWGTTNWFEVARINQESPEWDVPTNRMESFIK